MAKITKDDVLSYLENSNMLEISELIKDIEEKFNVSAAAPATATGAAAETLNFSSISFINSDISSILELSK